MNLLLVEDEPAIRSALTRALGRWGHRVCAADSIASGRAAAHESAPEALISDLKLPDGSGLDLAIDLGIPFVLMSGYGNFEDAVTALRNGCVDFLTKPVALDQLKGALHRLGEDTHNAPALISGHSTCSVVRAHATALSEHQLRVADHRWPSAQEAEKLFLEQIAPSIEQAPLRHIIAELMQVPGAERLVLNVDDHGHRCWLPVAADWDDPMHRDRRQVIEDLADRCWWRPQGAIVEYRHGP